MQGHGYKQINFIFFESKLQSTAHFLTQVYTKFLLFLVFDLVDELLQACFFYKIECTGCKLDPAPAPEQFFYWVVPYLLKTSIGKGNGAVQANELPVFNFLFATSKTNRRVKKVAKRRSDSTELQANLFEYSPVYLLNQCN